MRNIKTKGNYKSSPQILECHIICSKFIYFIIDNTTKINIYFNIIIIPKNCI